MTAENHTGKRTTRAYVGVEGVPASIEEIVRAATVEGRAEKVEQDILAQCFQPAVASIDQIFYLIVFLVKSGQLL